MKLIFTFLKSICNDPLADHLTKTIPGDFIFEDQEFRGTGWVAYKALCKALEYNPDWVGVLTDEFYYAGDFIPVVSNLCEKTRQDALLLHSRGTKPGRLIEKYGDYLLYRRLKLQPCAIAIYHKNTIQSILLALKIRLLQKQNNAHKTLMGSTFQAAKFNTYEYEFLVGRALGENKYDSAVVNPELCYSKKVEVKFNEGKT